MALHSPEIEQDHHLGILVPVLYNLQHFKHVP
jgi:hypothetical protein